MNINEGLIKTAMKIDHQRSLLDTSTCQTFTEVIVSDKANPYALGTRLRVNHGLIAEIEMMWTTTGYWGFNVDNYLKYTSSEDWGVNPRCQARHPRDAGSPPRTLTWMRSSKGKWTWCRGVSPATAPRAACIPARELRMIPVRLAYRAASTSRTGTSSSMRRLEPWWPSARSAPANATGGSGAPDTHLFRVENGKLRFVHTLTHLLQANGPGRGAQGKGAAQSRQGRRTDQPAVISPSS